MGIGALAGGVFGAVYTWNQVAAKNITTPDEAVFPEVPVRGPFSMYAQSAIITQHQLDSTEGLRFSEMEREVAHLDEAGNPSWTTQASRKNDPERRPRILDQRHGPPHRPQPRSDGICPSRFAIAIGITLALSGATFLSLRKALIA